MYDMHAIYSFSLGPGFLSFRGKVSPASSAPVSIKPVMPKVSSAVHSTPKQGPYGSAPNILKRNQAVCIQHLWPFHPAHIPIQCHQVCLERHLLASPAHIFDTQCRRRKLASLVSYRLCPVLIKAAFLQKWFGFMTLRHLHFILIHRLFQRCETPLFNLFTLSCPCSIPCTPGRPVASSSRMHIRRSYATCNLRFSATSPLPSPRQLYFPT